MYKFLQKIIDKYATPCEHIYYEVPGENILDFLGEMRGIGLLYHEKDISFNKKMDMLQKIFENKITTFWYISRQMFRGKETKSLINNRGHEPLHCGRKVLFKPMICQKK